MGDVENKEGAEMEKPSIEGLSSARASEARRASLRGLGSRFALIFRERFK